MLSHVAAPKRAIIPQTCHSFCDLVPLHMLFPFSQPSRQNSASHVMPSLTPPGRIGALFPTFPSPFVHPCITAFLLLCNVSLIPSLLPWTRNLLKGQTVLLMFVCSKKWHRVQSISIYRVNEWHGELWIMEVGL